VDPYSLNKDPGPLNPEPDPDSAFKKKPDPDPGFDDQKFRKYSKKIFLF
jgi:hypothetical protein